MWLGREEGLVSVEVLHACDWSGDEVDIAEQVAHEASVISPILESLHSSGVDFSVNILLDDTDLRINAEAESLAATAAWNKTGIPLDNVCSERLLSNSAGRMVDFYVGQNRQRDFGSLGVSGRFPLVDALKEGQAWLGNEGRPRPRMALAQAGLIEEGADPRGPSSSPPAGSSRGSRLHSIAVDIEMWSGYQSSPVWSCAWLAAWWQLVRLGFGSEEDLDDAIVGGSRAKGLVGSQTLTVLPTGLLEVEYAVRLLLSRMLPSHAATNLDDSDGFLNPTPWQTEPVLDRISYVFIPAPTAAPEGLE